MAPILNRITVATDLSARSDRATQRAFQLGRMLSLPVEVIMVLDDAMPETMRAPLHEKAVQQLEDLAARWAEGCAYTVNVQAGDPTEVLSQAGHDTSTLLVMGPHRPRPFLDVLRETTMQRVVRRSPAPVLLVTEPVLAPYANVLSLIDFNPAADAAFDLAMALAPDATLTPYHAVHIPYSGALDTTGAIQMDMQQSLHEGAVEQSKTWQDDHAAIGDRLSEMRVTLTPPDGMISAATEKRSCDLITAGAHGPVGAVRPLLGSVANDLMRNAPCDVLIGR